MPARLSLIPCNKSALFVGPSALSSDFLNKTDLALPASLEPLGAMGKTAPPTLYVFYVRTLRRLWRDRKNLLLFASGAGIQAVAHGAMAACAGLLGQMLLTSQPMAQTGFVDSRSPLFFCFLGFVLAVVKALAGTISVYGQRRAAFQVGNTIRQEIIGVLFVGGAQNVSSYINAVLVVRLCDVEWGIDEGVLIWIRAVMHCGGR